MSVGPRILFTRFIDGASPKLQPWLGHLRRVIPGFIAASEGRPLDDGAVVWQLVSANNRQLARGVSVHGAFDEATADAQRVVASASLLEVQLVSENGRGDYGWYATIDGVPALICARWYMTERDRLHSITLALASVGRSEILPGARLMHPALMASVDLNA